MGEITGLALVGPRLITRVLGLGAILAGQNITLCYHPIADNQRHLFFSDEDAGDGYVYMRTSGVVGPNNTVNWSFPSKIFVNGKGFKVHRESKFAAIFRLNPNMLILHCIDENHHLVHLRGVIEGDNITLALSISTYICAPRGNLAAVQVGNQTCILYRAQNLDLHLARIEDPEWQWPPDSTLVRTANQITKQLTGNRPYTRSATPALGVSVQGLTPILEVLRLA